MNTTTKWGAGYDDALNGRPPACPSDKAYCAGYSDGEEIMRHRTNDTTKELGLTPREYVKTLSSRELRDMAMGNWTEESEAALYRALGSGACPRARRTAKISAEYEASFQSVA